MSEMGGSPAPSEPSEFDWLAFIRSTYISSAGLAMAILVAMQGIDWGVSLVGGPAMRLPLSYVVVLLVLIALLAALSEALERLNGVPVRVRFGKLSFGFKTLITFGVLVVGVLTIYGLAFRQHAAALAAITPSPEPTATVKLDGSVAGIGGIDINPDHTADLGKPQGKIGITNPTQQDEKFRVYAVETVAPAYYIVKGSEWRSWKITDAMRSVVQQKILNDAGAQIPQPLPPGVPWDGLWFTLDKRNQDQIARYSYQKDAVYVMAQFLVTNGKSDTTLEVCGMETNFYDFEFCPPQKH